MKIIEHLQKLDSMIVDLTSPPATANLRNYLSTIIEQAEAEGDLPDVIRTLRREHKEEVLRIAKLYSEGKGIFIPESVLQAEKERKRQDT